MIDPSSAICSFPVHEPQVNSLQISTYIQSFTKIVGKIALLARARKGISGPNFFFFFKHRLSTISSVHTPTFNLTEVQCRLLLGFSYCLFQGSAFPDLSHLPLVLLSSFQSLVVIFCSVCPCRCMSFFKKTIYCHFNGIQEWSEGKCV